MIFEIDDLQMWLEDTYNVPHAYWNAVEEGTDREFLAQWLGYESIDDMEKYEMFIEYIEENDYEDHVGAHPTSHIENPPPKMDMELYYKWINWATSVAADEY